MVAFLRKRIELEAQAATYTTRNKYNRWTSTPSAGYQPTISKIKRLKTYALNSTATCIGLIKLTLQNKALNFLIRQTTSL